jgi:predicted RNA-binding protein with PIN domain
MVNVSISVSMDAYRVSRRGKKPDSKKYDLILIVTKNQRSDRYVERYCWNSFESDLLKNSNRDRGLKGGGGIFSCIGAQ